MSIRTFSSIHEMLAGPTVNNKLLEIVNDMIPTRVALQYVYKIT
jgi:hypothetical protein